MKEAHRFLPERPTYLLPEEAYEELKSIQHMLMGLARITYGKQSGADGDAMLMVSRAELHGLFQELGVLIGRALESVTYERRAHDAHWMWQ